MPKPRKTAYLLLLLSTILWGISPVIVKNSLTYISPEGFLFYRFVFALLIYLPIFYLLRKKEVPRNKIIIFIAAIIGTPLTLLPLYQGLNLTTSIEASILDSTSPIITVLLCIVFLKEKLSNQEKLGLAITFTGALAILIEPLLKSNFNGSQNFTGNLLILLSTFIWGVFLLVSKKYHLNTIYLNLYSFIVSLPIFLPLALNSSSKLTLPSQSLPGLLYMATAGSLFAFWAYMEGQKRIEASEAAVFGYLKPIFAIPLSILWLKESISIYTILGSLIIIVGVIISEKR